MMDAQKNWTAVARKAMDTALHEGASAVRVSLNVSLLDLVGVLNGEIDKLKHALDCSLQLCLFVDGRYGTFSTNCLDETSMEAFIRSAVAMVRMLEKDPCRRLPEPGRTMKDAISGTEAGLWDPSWNEADTSFLREAALKSALWRNKEQYEKGFRLISEEGELSVNVSENIVVDSNGLFACHKETSFEAAFEVTIESPDGDHFEEYWWDSSPFREGFFEKAGKISEEAVRRAGSLLEPKAVPGGVYTMVLDRECASKLFSPILNALSGSSIQQKNSFLLDKIGEKLFPSELTVLDEPRTFGATGAKFFDSEGVAANTLPIIENGVLKNYFISTYISEKTGLKPNIESWTRPVLKPFGGCRTREDLIAKCGEGILVTGFNGGNFNSATGDFSYGVEGFAFHNGEITHPVREMLITGNLLSLWASLSATADDARLCNSKLIPTLAFLNVSFSA